MALIRSLVRSEMLRYRTHDPIDATFYTHEVDGRKLFQINMKGRVEQRDFPEKVSQSVQFDEASAAQLYQALREHFKFK